MPSGALKSIPKSLRLIVPEAEKPALFMFPYHAAKDYTDKDVNLGYNSVNAVANGGEGAAGMNQLPYGVYNAAPIHPSERKVGSNAGDDYNFTGGDALSYSYGSLGMLSLELTLTLDGIACSAFGADEAAVLRNALATTLGFEDSYFGAMTCADASSRRLRSGARRLGTTSSAITFEVSVPRRPFNVVRDSTSESSGASFSTRPPRRLRRLSRLGTPPDGGVCERTGTHAMSSRASWVHGRTPSRPLLRWRTRTG